MSTEIQTFKHNEENVPEANTVDIGEEVQPKDAAGEFKNCIKETLSIVRNVSVKKRNAAKEEAAKS